MSASLIYLPIAVLIQAIVADVIGSWMGTAINVIAISPILHVSAWSNALLSLNIWVAIPIPIRVLVPDQQHPIIYSAITVVIHAIAHFWRMGIYVGVSIVAVLGNAESISIPIAFKAIPVRILGDRGSVIGGNGGRFLGSGARKEKQENHKNLHGHHTPSLGFWGGC